MAIEPINGARMQLVIPELESDLDVIQKLDDEPNDVGGLSAQELKAEFDEAGNAIKEYINTTLIPALSGTVAEEEIRAANEAQRVEAEAGRVLAEEDRVRAETARALAEEARAAAEQARANETSGIVTRAAAQAQAAAGSAGAASESASAAAGSAGAAASAKTAAEDARAGAESARTAAEQAVGRFVGRNLLDNSVFIKGCLVNQRGQTNGSLSSAGYTVDRFCTQNQIDFTVHDDCITVGSGDVSYNNWRNWGQYIENFACYKGKTLTLSALVKNCTGNGCKLRCAYKNGYEVGSVNIPAGDEERLVVSTFTVPEEIDYLFPSIGGPGIPGAWGIDVIAMKLEPGSMQTLAHQENGEWVLNEVPDHAEELEKCQRYLWPFSAAKSYPGHVLSGNGVAFTVSCPLRFDGVKPTIVGSPSFNVYMTDSAGASSAVSVGTAKPTYIQLVLRDIGTVAGRPATVETNADTTGVFLSKEL